MGAAGLAGSRCLRGDDSLKVAAPAELERRQEREACHLGWVEGAFSQITQVAHENLAGLG